MLARFAKVVWWFGLAIAALVLFLFLQESYERRDCTATLQLRASIARDTAAAIDKYKRDHPNPPKIMPGGSISPIDAFIANELAGPAPDVRDTVEHKQQVVTCQQKANTIWPLVIGFGLTLVLWSFAFILGGSFWIPSRR